MYDPDIHDALSNLRRLDGSIPVHDKYGPPVNFFAPSGSRKYWVKQSTPVLGCVDDMLIILFIVIILIIHIIADCTDYFEFCYRFFLFLTLDKAVCPFLSKYFDMPIWHPTDEATLDALLDAQVDM